MKRIGKIGMWVGCGVAMLVLTMAGSASGQIFGDSSEWENKYECNTHPSNDVWSPNAGGYGTITAANEGAVNYINVQMIASGEGFLYAADPYDLDATSNGGVAFEMRLRAATDGMIFRFDTSGTPGRRLANYIRTFRWTIRDGDNSAFINETVRFDLDWQTVRVECDDTNWRMYENGTLRQTQLSDHDNGNLSGYELSFIFWNGSPDFDIDYIRWTNGEPDLGTLVTLK